ncbi:MAG: glycosyltransferase [Chloroflexota bacterium]|nr:glycosyltransferase [Chloroflexota bacterium]MDE3193692.1 glycosyltransferase [Chloroflexota bacterium]
MPATLARCAGFLRALDLEGEIVVADDGSTDDTVAAVSRAAAELASERLAVRHLRSDHRGKGAAVAAGVLASRGDPVAFLDADLTIPVETIGDLLAALRAGADVAVASRYVPGSTVRRPRVRLVMSHVFRALVRALVPTGISDTQCGGKAYTAAAARTLFSRVTIDGFAFDAEVLFLARRLGYRVREVPLRIVQPDETSIHLLRDAPRMVRDLVLIRWRALTGRYA